MIAQSKRGEFVARGPSSVTRLMDWFREWKLFSLGLVLGTFLVCISIAAPVVAPYPPTKVDYPNRLQAPSAQHWFGTDEHGRDILSRVLHGARVSITIGAISVILAAMIGMPWGLSIGFIGGRLDTVSSRIIDAAFAFPGLLMALAVIAVMGRSVTAAIIAVAISRIPVIARVSRSTVISEKEMDYVEASRALGSSWSFILFRSLLPSVAGPILVLISMSFVVAVMMEAGLSYLGMSAQPPTPSIGNMIATGRGYLYEAPHYALFPGAMLALLILSLNLIGDGLRDFFDPRRQRGG